MTKNELTKNDIAIDSDIEVDDDNNQEIIAYIETWFDVDKKFNIDTSADDVWLNMYGKYNPFEDTLRVECEISKPNGSEHFDYDPSESEVKLIKDMITEKLQCLYDTTPKDFCQEAFDYFLDYGGPML